MQGGGTFGPNLLVVLSRRLACRMSVPFSLHWTIVHLQEAGQLTMKTILVPTQNISAMKSTLETALVLAQRTGAYIEGIPLWFGVPEFVVAELTSGFSMEIYRTRRKEETAGARKLFETFMQEHGVAAARTTAGRPWCGWFAEVPPGEDLVAAMAARLM